MPRVTVFQSRFFWKIYSTFSLLFLVTILLVSWIVSYRVQATLKANIDAGLRDKISFLVPQATAAFRGTPADAQALAKQIGEVANVRVTLIDGAGKVWADTLESPETMGDHWERPEVRQALKRPFGVAERHSDTAGESMLYVARAIREGDGVLGVVRFALPLDRIEKELASLRLTIGFIALLGIILALGLGWTLAKRVTVPIREMMTVAEALRNGRYEKKVRSLTSDELGQLGETLNRLGAELTSKISELHRLENVRRDFVANVSHEIKTPLTSIKGYVETLLGGAINDPQHNVRFLEKIDRNAERLTALVQDLLDLARIEAGEETFQPSPIEIGGIVHSVVHRHEDAVQRKSLKVKVAVPTAPMYVMADKEAMTQVLDNLLTNAIKYTPDDGKINVTLAVKGTWARLEVEDNGIGIPAEHLHRIFERFYRVDKARSREMGGTGLGLSIVKHLVSAMDGDVSVESQVGVGSKFAVRLKLAQ